MISLNEARWFAHAWVTAWNSHDIENIIRLYADNVVIVSPIAGKLLGNPEVAGIDAVKNYFMEGLRVYPDLRFAVLHVLPGEQSIVLHYLNQQGVEAAECMHFDNDGKILRMFAHYSALI